MTIYRDLTPPRLDPRQLRPVPCPAGRSRSREVRGCGAVELWRDHPLSEGGVSGDQCSRPRLLSLAIIVIKQSSTTSTLSRVHKYYTRSDMLHGIIDLEITLHCFRPTL